MRPDENPSARRTRIASFFSGESGPLPEAGTLERTRKIRKGDRSLLNIRLGRSLFLALVVLLISTAGVAQIGITVSFGPPALPIYVQPPCPTDGYLWVPGYWAYDPGFGDYYWVPGTWVEPPEVGFLWTPGYWGWGDGVFLFHQGYWGPVVGFYGGIAYGFGYYGRGYEGGHWDHDRFYYNRAVNNVNVTNVHNVYNTQITNINENRVSYNGGNGGVAVRPTPQEEAAARERHVPAVAAQTQHVQAARSDPQLRAAVNQGKPPIAATERPGAIHGNGAVPAKEAGAPYHPPANRAAAQPNPSTPAGRPANEPPARQETAPPARQETAPPAPVHAQDVQPHQLPPPPSTGNAKQDQKYQQQQQKLLEQQQKEHQQLQQQQQKEHQQLQKQQTDAARMQQMEQQHQQQTQQMEQRHAQQQQEMQQRQASPPNKSQPKQPPK